METKKSINKRYLMLLCATIMALLIPSALTGCTGEKEEFEFLPAETTVYKDLKPVTLTFCFPGITPNTWPEVKEQFEKQTGSTLNIKLDFKYLNTSYYQTINELSASDDIYDAFVCSQPQPYYSPDFIKLAKEGQITDISELFPKSAPELYRKFTKEELDYAKVDGKLYAVPTLYPQAYGPVILANARLIEKYGFQDIKTLDDYERYLELVKSDGSKLTPGAISEGVDTLYLFSRGSGYVIADPNQKLVYKWDDPQMKIIPWEKTPEFKTAVNYIISWYKKGYLETNPAFDKTASFIDFGTLTPPNADTTSRTHMTKTGDILVTEPLRTFHLFPDKPAQRGNPMGEYFLNPSFLFGSKSANTDRALMFLEWVHSDAANNKLMSYGIENKDYIIRDGTISLPENSDAGNYLFSGGWPFRNTEFLMSGAGSRGSIGGPVLKEFLDRNSKYPPHGALYPRYNELVSAANVRIADYKEFERQLQSGMIKDMSVVDEFIAKLEERGSESVANTFQKQLEEYKNAG